MVRMKKIQNVAIDSATKGVEPLTDAGYRKLEKMLRVGKDFSSPVKFDDTSEIIVGRLPDRMKIRENENKDGEMFWGIPVVLPGPVWTSFIENDDQEVNELETHAGTGIAIVANLVTTKKKRKNQDTDEWEEVEYINIKNVRGYMLLAEAPASTKPASDLKSSD